MDSGQNPVTLRLIVGASLGTLFWPCLSMECMAYCINVNEVIELASTDSVYALQSRTVVAENLPEEHSIESVEQLFSTVGT